VNPLGRSYLKGDFLRAWLNFNKKTKSSIPDLSIRDAKSEVSKNDFENAEILAVFFTFVFTHY